MPAKSKDELRNEIRAALERENITDLDKMVEFLAKKSAAKDSEGNPIVASVYITPGFLLGH